MAVLLMAPSKFILENSISDWARATDRDVVLFTSGEDAEVRRHITRMRRVFARIELFPKMVTNDLVEKRAIELNKTFGFKRIVALAESDILRAARLRERLGIEGQNVSSAVPFRNKIEMRRRAAEYGASVARFRKVSNTLELLDFIDEVKLPIVLEPVAGGVSENTSVIEDERSLDRLLDQGIFSGSDGTIDLLAEEYVEGDVYLVDGLFLGGKKVVINASRYAGDCRDFTNGAVLGSHTLDGSNPLKHRLEAFTEEILEKALPLPVDSPFHVEILVTPDGRLLLRDVVSSVGGGLHAPTIVTSGIDIKMEYVASQCRSDYTFPVFGAPVSAAVAGSLLIPPAPARLAEIPRGRPFPWVKRALVTGVLGRTYGKIMPGNTEVANYLIVADSELEIRERMLALRQWFDSQTRWVARVEAR